LMVSGNGPMGSDASDDLRLPACGAVQTASAKDDVVLQIQQYK
jgi:hypothetical protein